LGDTVLDECEERGDRSVKKEESIKALVEKAERSLEAANLLFEKGNYDFSVSRAYYTMFYCAEALLFAKDLSFSKHSAVIAAFGKEFVKTGLLSKKLHKYLLEAFEDRLSGDYNIISTITKEKSEETLKRAVEFLKETKKYLKIK